MDAPVDYRSPSKKVPVFPVARVDRAIRVWDFYPPIPAHDAKSGERTGTCAPAHVYLQRARRLGPVHLLAVWSTGRARVPVTFDKEGWAEVWLPVTDPNAHHFELAFEEGVHRLPYSVASGRSVPIVASNDIVQDSEVNPPPPPPEWIGAAGKFYNGIS